MKVNTPALFKKKSFRLSEIIVGILLVLVGFRINKTQ